MSFLDQIRDRARKTQRTIILPEGDDERVVKAAGEAAEQGLAHVVLLGERDAVARTARSCGARIDKVTIIDPAGPSQEQTVETFYELRKHKGITRDQAREMLMQNLVYYGGTLVKNGLADGFIAGASHTTADVARTAIYCLEVERAIGTISGSFFMEVPDCRYGEQGLFVYADCGIIPDPSAKQLAGIARASAKTFRKLVQKEPKVALLSYSTKGSAEGPLVDKVRQAVALLQQSAPDLLADGELQGDSALVPEVAARKLKDSPVAGQANVLIFPNLDSGNICYKLTQRLAKARAIGPLIQGVTKPCSDLSRGCSIEDVVDAVAVISVLST